MLTPRIFALTALLVFLSLISPVKAVPAVTPLKKIADSSGIVLASKTIEPCPIVIMANGTPVVQTARSYLAEYLSKITGQKFPSIVSSDPIPARAILLGPVEMSAPKELGPEGFVIKTVGQKIHIVGGSERGTLYGMFWFLENYAGCKWWSYNEEDIPQETELKIAAIDIREKPAFKLHDIFNREAQNGPNFVYKIHATSNISFTGGHTLYPLLRSYAEKNPEFWPMDEKGRRKANDVHFNYLAPGISQALADAFFQEVSSRNNDIEHYIYQAGMGDWYGGVDMSPDSQKMYEDETWTDPDGVKKPGYIAPLLVMLNQTAAELDKKYPGIQLGTFAYMSLEAPPAHIKPAPNVNIWIPRLRHDTVLSVEESPSNRSFRLNLERWLQIAPGHVYIWEYGANFSNFMMPFPCLRSMAANIKYYHRIGVQGVMIQGNYTSTGGDLAVLKNYVFRKLLWDPTLDVDTLVRGFCKGYYGPAAPEMIAYVNLLEDSVRKPKLISASEFDDKRVYLTPELLQKLRGLIDKGLAKTKRDDSDPYYRRMREAMVSLDAWDLMREDGSLAERDGKLIRTDIDKEHGGQYTFERALETTKYSRNASPGEWGMALYYQRGFLSLQGGPLYTLHRGKLTVKVAPYNSRHIWQVISDGQQAIDGSSLSLDPRTTYFETDGEPTEAKISMQSILGIEAWSPEVKQTANETVEVIDDHTFRIVGTISGKLKGFETNQPSIETRYSIENDTGILFEAMVNGAWQAIMVSPEAPKAAIPSATQLRITRPGRGLIILDKYSAPSVEGSTLSYDTKDNTVKTVMKLPPLSIALGQTTPAYVREIEVEPLRK